MSAPLRLVMLGPPGAGKGTQAQILERRYGVRQISTGDILRRHRAEKTALGLEAQPYMDRGDLVPDSIIIGMMETDLPRDRGFVLDGFPRTVPQAEALDEMLSRLGIPLTLVLLFDCERAELIKRLTGRWTNPRTGRVYHDTLETVTRRLDVYARETAPLIDFYAESDLLTRVDAMQPVDHVTQQIVSAIELRGGVTVS
jgi:adenylate kinase